MMMTIIIMYFLQSKGPQTGLAPGGPINYDDDDDIDDNTEDDDDDDDEDDDDDDSDSNDVLFLLHQKTFL